LRREAVKLLWDMRDAGAAVAEFLAEKSLADYDRDLLLRSAVERQIFIVGEALSQLSRWDDALADQFDDKRQIIGLRNLLAHGYFSVLNERIFSIAINDLPALMSTVDSLLADGS
jgi:uncharacterized protein with HEPN domain